MVSPENVATPATAACVAVPPSVPPPGFVPIATVTFPVKPVAVLPHESSAVTRTAGVIAAPAGPSLGRTANTSGVPAPGATANAPLVAVDPLAVATRVAPGPSPPALRPGTG